MLELKALAGIQAQRNQLDARRGEQSGKLYQQGLTAFAQASQSDFADRAALREALVAWIEAIKQQRSNPAPYIALGYLFSLLGDGRTAIMYLKAAQNLDPAHPDPPVLIQHLLEAPVKAVSAQKPAIPAPTVDDESYEDLEDLLLVWIGRVQVWPLPVASLTPELHRQLAQCHQELAQAIAQFEKGLQELETEFDVADLRKRLRPLESRLQQYSLAIQQSRELAQLNQEITRFQGKVEQALQPHSHGANLNPQLETEIEQWLDDCDAIADQLEALEAKSLDISSLLLNYESLSQLLAKLQDQLDEQD
ncbi:MAG: hypothetical protein CVV27_05415 [Candidatus Melainabacteria bacterium HGW-Melainabacteria-1]|nr:MAG: hypothetical protein CVV27_05415 [Candidatus Melainabacteria bacterium HGW-Melainabacteria-1]